MMLFDGFDRHSSMAKCELSRCLKETNYSGKNIRALLRIELRWINSVLQYVLRRSLLSTRSCESNMNVDWILPLDVRTVLAFALLLLSHLCFLGPEIVMSAHPGHIPAPDRNAEHSEPTLMRTRNGALYSQIHGTKCK